MAECFDKRRNPVESVVLLVSDQHLQTVFGLDHSFSAAFKDDDRGVDSPSVGD